MRVVVQRVADASVRVGSTVVGSIGHGLLLLVGFAAGDDDPAIEWMAEKISGLRIFPDDADRMNRDVRDVGGSILVVSQFTLYGDARKGRRPSFVDAAQPDVAQRLYEQFAGALRARGLAVETGIFGARMAVSLVNDGPVTLLLER